MSMKDRLIAARNAASLSVTDMSTWFDISRQTMHNWLKEDTEISDYRIRPIEADLVLLEKAIKAGKYFPMPKAVTQFTRKEYIESTYDGLTDRVSKSRSSGRRQKVLGKSKKKG